MATSKIENSAQSLSFKLKFIHTFGGFQSLALTDKISSVNFFISVVDKPIEILRYCHGLATISMDQSFIDVYGTRAPIESKH